ncbi:MAG TPA: hypothetical protein VF116_07495 [Ktedonobacterales bacterium]
MATATSSPSTSSSSNTATGPYTGVVVIHGIGNEKRNATIEEAGNALTYWYNHIAGLALRPTGPSRVWLTTRLTEDDDPDAPASCATMTLSVPGDGDGADDTLRLELREVWWAQSFGLPSVGAALGWARLQFREDAARFLLPLGVQSGPARAAAKAPARQTPQAVTYRPQDPDDERFSSEYSVHQPQRATLRFALACYGIVQYVWKLAQWFVLAPVVYALLLAVGLVNLLALIPWSYIQYTLVNGLSRVVGVVSLHWIAPLQVYLLDYTRSSAIRQRFERELDAFLRDDNCRQIVVIAHSMGTVIAYEGLTTTLSTPKWRGNTTPITFICLAQALHRMWMLEGTDPHRLRTPLPSRVRWLHFWARYDPVAAGPITVRSLRRVPWADPGEADPQDAIAASLERCENVDVVNTDSLFTDHGAYWQNVEQVIGPVARELVSGHPALEKLVDKHLATPGDILRRRANVAWRSSLALAVGIALTTLLIVVDAQNGFVVGDHVRQFMGTFPGRLFNFLFGPIVQLLTGAQPTLGGSGSGLSSQTSGPVVVNNTVANVTYSVLSGILLGSIGILATHRAVAMPSPFAFKRAGEPAGHTPRAVFVAAVTSMLLLFVAEAWFLSYYSEQAEAVVIDPGLHAVLKGIFTAGQVLAGVTGLICLYDIVRNDRAAWLAPILFSGPMIFFSGLLNYQYAIVALLVTLTGCLLLVPKAILDRRWRWPAFLLPLLAVLAFCLVVLIVAAIVLVPVSFLGTSGAPSCLPSTAHPACGSTGGPVVPAPAAPPLSLPLLADHVLPPTTLITGLFAYVLAYVAPLFPAFVYVLDVGSLVPPPSQRATGLRAARLFSGIAVTLVTAPYALVGLYLYITGDHSFEALIAHPGLPLAGAEAAVALGVIVSLVTCVRERRWGWLVWLLVGGGALIPCYAVFVPSLLDPLLLGPATALLTFSLWARPSVART